jgi:predicted HD phosphohydrolase
MKCCSCASLRATGFARWSRAPAGHAEIRRASVYTTGRGSIALAFGPAVAEPVALHVQAKRCLVGMQRGYRDSLSVDSIRSLALQGGPMSPMEVDAFLLLPRAKDALRLRAWHDRAKDNALRPATADQAIEGLRLLMQEVQAAT